MRRSRHPPVLCLHCRYFLMASCFAAYLKYTSLKGTSLLLVAGIVLYAMTASAQNVKDTCGPIPVIPLAGSEPPAKIVIDPPLAEPLASRGVAIIQYCAENLHLVPVFGPNALAVSPRVGHTFTSQSTMPHGCGQMRVANQSL